MGPLQERSAGGVVVRTVDGRHQVAVIRPRGRQVLALPKGHIDGDETAAAAAAREVKEETGIDVRLRSALDVVRYSYRFRGRLIAKEVTFFLFEHAGGEIDALDPKMRVEVDRALWLPIGQAIEELSYPGERGMVSRAQAILLAEPTTGP